MESADTINLPLIKVGQLAQRLNVTQKTIYNMIESKKIPYYRIGKDNKGDYRFDIQAVLHSLSTN